MFKERQKLFLERCSKDYGIISIKISDENFTDELFSSKLFSASFVKNPEAAIRGAV